VFGIGLVLVKPLLRYVLSLWGQRNNLFLVGHEQNQFRKCPISENEYFLKQEQFKDFQALLYRLKDFQVLHEPCFNITCTKHRRFFPSFVWSHFTISLFCFFQAEKIALQAREYVRARLSPEHIFCYYYVLLQVCWNIFIQFRVGLRFEIIKIFIGVLSLSSLLNETRNS
jgi:hypothetical protein